MTVNDIPSPGERFEALLVLRQLNDSNVNTYTDPQRLYIQYHSYGLPEVDVRN